MGGVWCIKTLSTNFFPDDPPGGTISPLLLRLSTKMFDVESRELAKLHHALAIAVIVKDCALYCSLYPVGCFGGR